MIFHTTPLSGAYLISQEPRSDERGIFARAFCAREFLENGLETSYVQANISSNKIAGTVRGMHLQRAPYAEVKLVSCANGALYDVIVDCREESPTYLQWFGAEISAGNGLMMYVPKGFAHGYQSLSDGATAHYMVSTFYEAGAEAGYRFDDPAVAIRWPRAVTSISDKDKRWPLLTR